MRVTVIGATGNVGTPLVSQLREAGCQVRGVARRISPDLRSDVEWVSADISRDPLTPLVVDADVVVHLAWAIQPTHDPDELYRVNVEGSRRVFAATFEAGVPALVCASSVGAYAPAPDRVPRDESWPATGISSSRYSRHKAAQERLLDQLEADALTRSQPLRVVRMRPAITLSSHAASEIKRYFLGYLAPAFLLAPAHLRFIPHIPGLTLQLVAADDVARAYVQACLRDVEGPFNLAAEPAIDAQLLAETALELQRPPRLLPLPAPFARTLVALTWALRLQPTDAGWLDMGRLAPWMDTDRARTELGWSPQHAPTALLLEFLEELSAGSGGVGEILAPAAQGRVRAGEILRGLTGRTGAEKVEPYPTSTPSEASNSGR